MSVFTNMRSALACSTQTLHRLEHLGRGNASSSAAAAFKGPTLREVAVTDLLMGRLAGETYEVTSDCPECARPGACAHWDTNPVTPTPFQVRQLTQREEGGAPRKGIEGANADFILQWTDVTNSRAIRVMIQAKVRSAAQHLVRARDRNQLQGLIGASGSEGAAPYYAVYMNRGTPHVASLTLCPRRLGAADTSICLVPITEAPDFSGPSALERPTDTIVQESGRPITCLLDCTCSGPARRRPARPARPIDSFRADYEAALRFVQRDHPGYQPVPVGDAPSSRVIEVSNRQTALPRHQPRHGEADAAVVRLGPRRTDGLGDREWYGFDRSMTPGQVADATRMYWRMAPHRAQRLEFLVASNRGRAVAAYRIMNVTVSGRPKAAGRIIFEVREAENSEKQRLFPAAEARLRECAGSSSPFFYFSSSVGAYSSINE
ncbi:MAG: hypothetical protein U0Q15_09565 [Kineosporiaceae bacterium]